MTNPDNAVRVRARNGGRASVYEANGWAQIYKQGLLAGTGVTEDTRASMNVLVGGSQSAPDVVIAETASHYKIGMDIVGQVPVTITAPGSNSRLTAIIVYTDDLSVMSEETSITGSPATCGLITVNGDTHASNPQPPSDSQIRQVITADGATGGQAAYAVIALVKVSAGVENISNSMITIQRATDAIVTPENVDWTTIPRIVAVGNYKQNLPAGQGFGGENYTVSIPTQPDTNYEVFFSEHSAHAYDFSVVNVSVVSKSTSSFTFNMRNSSSSSSHEISLSYMIVRKG